MIRTRALARPRLAVIAAAAAVVTLALMQPAPASATPASSNPLVGFANANYTGSGDPAYSAYRAATGNTKTLLGKIALRSRMRWFGAWITNADIHSTLASYIANVTTHDKNALVQMGIFRLVPTERDARTKLPSAADQASYKQWIDRAASTIGSTHAVIDLQPDLPVWTHEPNGSKIALNLVHYAAQKFHDVNKNAVVYLNAGAADWSTVSQAVSMLRTAGIGLVRGFTLDDTHYDSLAHQIQYGAKLVGALNSAGIKNKHFVVNTAENGRPYTFASFHGSDYNNGPACPTHPTSSTGDCVTLGVPPTTNVTNPAWHLGTSARNLAGKYADAYMWIGRPWLVDQAGPWSTSRALQLARSTPF